MKHLLVTTALATILAAGPAMAQQQSPKSDMLAPNATQAPAQTQNPMQDQMKSSDQAKSATEQPAGPLAFVAKQETSDWLASNLIGRTVKNRNNEALGDINDVIVGQDGKVVAVLIGVGGFLGIGEKEVGVPFEALEFKKAEEMPQESSQGTGPAGTAGTSGGQRARAPSAQADDDQHSNMEIVLAVTREVLESAPPYAKIGEEPESSDGQPGNAKQ